MTAVRYFLSSVILCFLVAGCGGPPPGGHAEGELRTIIDERSDGNIALANLRKTDGQMREENGVQFYEMDVEGAIEIRTTCFWRPKYTSLVGKQFSTTTEMPNSEFDKINPKYSGIKSEPGEQFEFSGSITFEEKESGWNFSRMDLAVER